MRRWLSAEHIWHLALERSGVVRVVLRMGSWGYGGVIATRNWLYDRRLLRTHQIGIPTISVGNISMGGTGKTPFVQLLARSLDCSVAIVSRGYGGAAEKSTRPLVVRPGMLASLCGDEPACLVQNLPDALVIVGRDRVAGAQLAQNLGAEMVILDDGFQHRRLHRDRNIVLIDGCETESLFPRGRLREGVHALARADLVLRRDQFCLMPTAICGESAMPLAQLVDHPVGLFCGLGKPAQFKKTVQALGGQVVHQQWAGDHQVMTVAELAVFAKESQQKGAQSLLCTQKDWVKLPRNLDLPLPLGYLIVHLQPNEPDLWQSQLEKILS